ncbi:MAG: ATP-binding cassette domain-containing protein, partial [Spirochaetaceae bacterium]|nr:ATP-binding cassette domain-containing protein [Spirochaetaceae bacterium]
ARGALTVPARPATRAAPAAGRWPGGGGGVRFRDVSFSFGGEDEPEALSDIDLTIPAGSRLAVLGATGSGKTTLISLLLRLYDPTRGVIEIDDVDIRGVAMASLRSQIGVVLQDTVLFAATIGENIAFGRPNASQAEIEAAAEAAQIRSFIEGLPERYDTPVGERGVTLSGGQKQRIAIARALLTDPRILILDDATSSVDARTEGRILSALRDSAGARTMIVIAQRASTCKDADAVVVLEEGRIAAYGTHEELLAGSPLYAAIFASAGTAAPSPAPAGGDGDGHLASAAAHALRRARR